MITLSVAVKNLAFFVVKIMADECVPVKTSSFSKRVLNLSETLYKSINTRNEKSALVAHNVQIYFCYGSLRWGRSELTLVLHTYQSVSYYNILRYVHNIENRLEER